MLGFDIGGANTKAALLCTEKAEVAAFKAETEYFPVWKTPQKLADALISLKERLGADKLVALGVTMTAELSDAYQTKQEGVRHILSCVKKAFPSLPIFVLTTDAELLSFESAEKNPLCVAAANWAATGWLAGQYLRDAVVVDCGSTSTSIIPIANGQTSARGKTDLDKLICGELVYTGSLRTNVAAIVRSIPTRYGVAPVSSEFFALSGDVHLVLGNISEADYTPETADGRGKTLPEAYARLARVVCADTDMLTNQEIAEMARYIRQEQIKQIAEGLTKTYKYIQSLTAGRVPVVVAGLGKSFLARKAAEKTGADAIIDLDTLLPKQAVLAASAAGGASMGGTKHTGEKVTWTYQ